MSNLKNNGLCQTFFTYILCAILVLVSGNLVCGKELKLNFAKNMTGELSLSFLQDMKDLFNINTFIETGTYEGVSSSNAAKVFDQVETIELSADFYTRAKESLKGYKNITVYHGDSAKMLNTMISVAKGNILFWLDGHYSANGSALGDLNTPILEELKHIKQSGLKNAVIMIDDIRFFDKHINKLSDPDIGGYPTLSEVRSLLMDINPDYDVVVIGDILVAYEKSENIKASDVVRACSITRDFSDISEEELDQAEQAIGDASGLELKAIYDLYYIFCNQEHFTKYGIGAHYALWYALLLINNKSFDHALQILKGPMNLGMDLFYIKKLINRVNAMKELA